MSTLISTLLTRIDVPEDTQAFRIERREAVLTARVLVNLTRYVICVGESSKQAKDSSLKGEDVRVHWQEAESCFTASSVMSANFSSVRSV